MAPSGVTVDIEGEGDGRAVGADGIVADIPAVGRAWLAVWLVAGGKITTERDQKRRPEISKLTRMNRAMRAIGGRSFNESKKRENTTLSFLVQALSFSPFIEVSTPFPVEDHRAQTRMTLKVTVVGLASAAENKPSFPPIEEPSVTVVRYCLFTKR